MIGAAYKICPQCGGRSPAESHFCSSCGSDIMKVQPHGGDPYTGLVLADKYVIEDLIGEGAMGRVYRATQLTLGKTFAAKILAPHLLNDEASHARFASEAHNAASLNHPNCVSVVDYGQTPDGITYIVMEYVHGITLERLIAEQYPLARERIVDLVVQVLAALTEAHGLGILHRDLKPENILIQQLRTHGELAKVLDFGIAKLMEDQATAGTGLTSQGMVCGTPEYMSPEQARGHKLDARSDLYAVGVILYQMMTGRPPFESASAVDVLHKHLHEEPVPPSQLLGEPPDPLEAVCLKAMAKDPNNRYAGAVEFREELIAATTTQAKGDRECERCGADMRPEHRFCPACGMPAPPESSHGSGQRRRQTSRMSGMWSLTRGEPTAEVVVRNFPLPLAGREHVLQRARTVLTRPQPGVRVRVFAGPRGIGKTRLADETASLAESMGWRAYYVGADPSGARTSLWPIQCMVAQLLELDLATVSTQELGRVANLSGLSFEVLPGLAELFVLHGPAHDLEIGVRRRECFSSAVQAMLSGGRGQPLLLIFDDIDGFDTASREILGRLATAPVANPVLVLCTSAEPNVDWLGGAIEQLEPLQPDSVERLGRQVTMEVRPQSTLPEALAKVAPLSPLKLESHLRLLAMGLQAPSDATDEELLRTRFRDFGPVARKVMEVGSILGERFLESDLIDLLDADGSDTNNPDLDEALRTLHVGGMLIIIGNGERAFSHSLLHELVYGSLPEKTRRHLHTLAASVSRVARASSTVRALHMLRAHHGEAVGAVASAANNAERAFDDPAATEFLIAALHVIDEKKARVHLALEVDLTEMASRVMRTGEHLGEAIELLEERLARGGFSPKQEAILLAALGEVLVRAKRSEDAIRTLKRALGPAMSAGDRRTMARVYDELGRCHANRDDFERALAELKEGLDMFTLGEGPRADVDFDIWRYLLRMCDYSRHAGRPKEARDWVEHALWHAERREDRLGLLRCHAHYAWVLRDLRQSALAEQHLARALDEARHFGDRLTTAQLLIERARARAARGRLTEARRCCEEALRLARGIQWEAGIEHAERAIAMLSQEEDPEPTSPSEHSGRFVAVRSR